MIDSRCWPPRADRRGQSEVLDSLLLVAVVVIGVSITGLAVVTSLQDQAAAQTQSIDVSGTADDDRVTVTHNGGRAISLSNLDLIVRSGGSSSRYDLDGAAVSLTGDGDESFEPGETANATHPYTGTIEVMLVETRSPAEVHYRETFEAAGDDGGASGTPTVDRFDLSDTSSEPNASYSVTWRATDSSGDITDATLSLVDQGTGAVVDSSTTSFGTVADTGNQSATLFNESGAGEVYVIELSVTDAAGNTVTEIRVDTADSQFGLRDPVVETYDVSDTTSGNTASYEATYNVSDPDGDLTEVQIDLVDASNDTVVDSVNATDSDGTSPVSGVATLSAGDKTKGEQFFINLTATDLNGGTAESSVSDVADGGGGGGGGSAAPIIEQFDAVDSTTYSGNNNNADVEYDVTWNVTDDQSNLETVTLELVDSSGNTRASESYTVSGGQANGFTELIPGGSVKDGDEVTVRITATDTDGNSATEFWEDTVDGDGSN